MNTSAINQIVEKLKHELAQGPDGKSIAIVGRTLATPDLIRSITEIHASTNLIGVYACDGTASKDEPILHARAISQLDLDKPDIVIIASDEHKERFIEDALPFLTPQTKILIGGYRHFEFQNPLFASELANAFAPSFANGYPNTLIHIFQCLQKAARLNLSGVVAEFGMFKGGTTMLISRFIEALGRDWTVFGFDTFDGFPPARSPLDMYSHPDCVYMDLKTVERYFDGRNVEIVPGDVVETVSRLIDEEIVLAFIDTDNYTSATAIIDVIADRVVPNGAVVFDHFTGRNRFLYTLGERIAAKHLLDDPRFFNLHDTGVFLRLS